MSTQSPLLQVRNLSVGIPPSRREPTLPHQPISIVKDVSFDLYPGEILGVVGESGCGKSMMCMSLLNLLDAPLTRTSGTIAFRGRELHQLPESEYRRLRGDQIAAIFQDPMTSLNPVLTIGEQLRETMECHHTSASAVDISRRILEVLHQVGLTSPKSRLASYPHEFSGGMRQRVVIAMAFLNKPRLIIADEPTTALDVTIQGQILAEVQSLAAENGTALIWVSHDLALLSGFTDRIMVMYGGQIVEMGKTMDVISAPSHPYTRALIRAIPDSSSDELEVLDGIPPNFSETLTGCAFAPRCTFAQKECLTTQPAVKSFQSHQSRCHYPLNQGALL